MNQDYKHSNSRLIDYLVFVGPENKRSDVSYQSNSQDHSFSAPPSILNRFPVVDHADFGLAYDVAYFCQPEGSSSHSEDTTTHVFMLTHTETNRKTYGVCVSFPHLFDPPALNSSHKTEIELNSTQSDDIHSCIQEWGTLSLCLLSKHPFFNFLRHCLTTLMHFVQDLGETEPLWKELLDYKSSNGVPHTPVSRRQRVLTEIVSWIEQLLLLDSPEAGSSLEVELEVDPAVTLAYPSIQRLPLFELSVCRMFKKLDVVIMIEIFKLVLSEHKVIVHSADCSFAAECVLTMLTLLYPVQYLYPLIPLLPTSMPMAENLLMVPTPFFIGVCSSFLHNLHEVHLAEVWLVNLDTKEIKSPTFLDQPVLEFPYSILQLQADIRQALDKLDTNTPEGSHITQTGGHVTSTPASVEYTLSLTAVKLSVESPEWPRHSPPAEDSYWKHLESDVDVMIRVAFVEFFFNIDMLGLIDQYLCIYRLFPRPVVSIRKSAFMSAYEKINSASDVKFMRELLSIQGIEYFFEWSLNPPNAAYEEIRRGFHEVNRVSDKQFHYIHNQAFKTKQVCLYNPSPDSLLYQGMLTFKATQTTSHSSVEVHSPDEDSDWEFAHGVEHYDGDSESSYFTEGEGRETSSSPFQILSEVDVVSEEPDDMLDDVEVGYCSTRKVLSSTEQVPKIMKHNDQPSPQLLPQTGQKMPRPKSLVTIETNPPSTLSSGRKSHSFEDLSLDQPSFLSPPIGDHSNACLTSTEYLTAQQFDTDTEHPHTDTGEPIAFTYSSSDEETPEDFQYHDHSSPPQNSKLINGIYRTTHPLHTSGRGSESSDSSTYLEEQEHRHYGTPGSSLPRELASLHADESGYGQVSRTMLAMSAFNHSKLTTDNQIIEIVSKVVSGNGLPWPKPAALKRLSSYEKTRVLILRHLEERLGIRSSNDVVMATSAQIIPVGVSRAMYRGVLDLLKLLLSSIEDDFSKEPEGPLFSAFLVFRVAFSVYYEPKARSTLGFSLRKALSVSTSVMATEAKQSPTQDRSPLQRVLSQSPGSGSRAPPTLRQRRLSSISSQDELMNQLINSPRFYHPREGQDVQSFNFLYKELLKGQGTSRPFLLKREFWNIVFMSTIDADRGYLGWNEHTADLYNRYNSLPEVHQRTFGSEEDHLLSIIAHNLLVYMLMAGISSQDTMATINDFTARTRLATFEERLLQQTIRYLEDNASNEIDLSHLGLMGLYSEIHPTISHIVHYGVNMIAPVYNLQITSEALILRLFPDERITSRLWNDRITNLEENESRATVSVWYSESHGEYAHHFHTKEYQRVFESLKALAYQPTTSLTTRNS